MNRVAFTGFGVVSAVGVGRAAFWRALREGRSGVGRISRFDCGGFAVQHAAEVKAPPELPAEVARIAAADPKIGFAWAACAEALEQAGVVRLGPRALLHLGTSVEVFDLERLVRDGDVDLQALARQSAADGERPFQTPPDAAPRAIAAHWGRPEQLLTNCSACAAGAPAVGHAFRRLRAGRFELAVRGGFDSMINPLGVGGFQLLGALTTDNERGATACRSFDAARVGTVLGAGAAVLVLEPLEKARAEGKTILAEVCGYGSTLDAHGLSAPDPDGDGAARCMTAALADAGLAPEQIAHINTHGAGTRFNDEIEATAIRRVFDGVWEQIPTSATKSMTGHAIGAAGALEAGACLLPLLEGVAPPNPSLEKVGQGCELHHVVGEAAPVAGEYALSNSFGFGGQNATLILRRYDGA